jgi:hypothetical protein
MQYDRVIEQAVQDVLDLLWINLPPTHRLPDERMIACLMAIIGAPEIQRAIEHGSDTALSFVLRGVNRILSETELPPGAMLNLLWDIMEEPELYRLLGTKQNSRAMVWRKKPPA